MDHTVNYTGRGVDTDSYLLNLLLLKLCRQNSQSTLKPPLSVLQYLSPSQ